MRKKIFLLFIYIYTNNLCCQVRYNYQQFTIEDGLPTNAIYDIVEGKDGKMYIGTDNGLSVYDGIKFKNYNTKDGLYNPYIVKVERGLNNDIFCATYLGKLCKFSKENISVHQTNFNLGNTAELYIFKNKFIYNHLYKGTHKNTSQSIFYQFYESSFHTKDINYLYDLGNQDYPSVFKYKNQSIFIKNRTFKIGSLEVRLPENIPTIFKIEVGIDKLYLLSASQLHVSDFRGNILQTLNLPANIIYGSNRCYTMIDAYGDLWVNIQLIGMYKMENGKWVLQNSFLGFKKDESINAIYCDSKGRIWITTFNNGLFLISNIDTKHYVHNEAENRFSAIAVLKDSQIYSTTRYGLFKMQENSLNQLWKRKNEFKLDRIHNEPIFLNTTPEKIKWGGLKTYVAKKVINYKGKVLTYGLGSTIQNYSDKNKFKYTRNLKPKNSKIISLGDTLLCANTDSVFKATILNDTLIQYHYSLKLSTIGFIYDMLLHNDTLIIAESNQIKFFYKERLIKTISKINDVPLESINKIELRYNKLWIYASNGIYFIDNRNESRVINKHNFLPSSEVSDILLNKDRYYFATNNGIAVIPKNIIESNSSKPIINITSYFTDSVHTILDKKIELNAKDNFLQIYFDIQCMTNKKNLIVQYSLDNNQWNRMDLSELDLNNLSSGNVNLKIRTKDVNSDWAYTEVKISKQYPFYLQWWFILFALGFISLAYYFFYKFKLNKEIELTEIKNKMFSQIIELRQSALSAMMNPHFIFNSLNAIQYFINSNQKEKSSEYLAKLSRLVRLFLNHASEPSILLAEEIDRLKRYVELEQMRFYPFEFKISVSENLDVDKISIPNMILQPFVENAILHGISHLENKDGVVLLDISANDNILKISITDNGYGMDKTTYKESSHISKALTIIKERIEIMQKQESRKVYKITEEVPYMQSKRSGHRVCIYLST